MRISFFPLPTVDSTLFHFWCCFINILLYVSFLIVNGLLFFDAVSVGRGKHGKLRVESFEFESRTAQPHTTKWRAACLDVYRLMRSAQKNRFWSLFFICTHLYRLGLNVNREINLNIKTMGGRKTRKKSVVGNAIGILVVRLART